MSSYFVLVLGEEFQQESRLWRGRRIGDENIGGWIGETGKGLFRPETKGSLRRHRVGHRHQVAGPKNCEYRP